MKRLMSRCVLVLLIGTASAVWAGAHEEIAKLREQWTRAFNEGNLEAMGALLADDVTRFAAPDPFRAEGKAAILAQFAGTFQANPTRRMVLRHGSIQVYGDSTAVYTGYERLTFVDRAGRVTSFNNRVSHTFAKVGGEVAHRAPPLFSTSRPIADSRSPWGRIQCLGIWGARDDP